VAALDRRPRDREGTIWCDDDLAGGDEHGAGR